MPSLPSITTEQSRVLAPFGSWKLDSQLKDIKPSLVPQEFEFDSDNVSPVMYLRGDETYYVSTVESSASMGELEPLSSRRASIRRTLHMMLLAGEECTTQPTGRVFDGEEVIGFIQRAVNSTIRVANLTADLHEGTTKISLLQTDLSPARQIESLCQLVARLHSKGVIHGDIKPDNLVSVNSKDGFHYLLNDFSSSNLESVQGPHTGHSMRYLSPFRASPTTLSLHSSYTALIFDLGDVLFNWSAETRTSISPKILKQILSSATWRSYERGRLSEQECYKTVGARFRIAPDEIREALDQARSSLVASHSLIKLIRELKEESYGTLRVYAMSNISLPDWEVLRTKPVDWSIFDRVFTSGEAGERKPDPAFYEHVIAETGVDPSSTIFVDKRPENVEAASAFGFRGVLFDTEENVQEALVSVMRPTAKCPLSKADDLYAAGITAWEIWTGERPFGDDTDDLVVEDLAASGFQPNLSAIDDPKIRELVSSYLQQGNPPLPNGTPLLGQTHCISAEVVYADCLTKPPHTCEKTVHSQICDSPEDGCAEAFRSSLLLSHVERVKCPQCSL